MLQHKNASTGAYENWLGWITNGSTGQSVTFYAGSYGYSLTNGNYYRIAVAARDNAGNTSEYAVLSAERQALPAKVGFLYYLSTDVERSKIQTYLQTLYVYNSSGLTYSKLTQLPTTEEGLNEYNTLFVASPSRPLNPTELSWLSAFVSGFQKRMVLVGENGFMATSNGYLNELANRIGVGTTFDTGTGSYDNATSDVFSCSATTSHYLCSGVTHIGDAGSLSLVLGSSCNVVAWLRNAQNGVLAVEEDTADAGSRVLIQDCDVFNSDYMGQWDNWRFVYNLCTLYRR